GWGCCGKICSKMSSPTAPLPDRNGVDVPAHADKGRKNPAYPALVAHLEPAILAALHGAIKQRHFGPPGDAADNRGACAWLGAQIHHAARGSIAAGFGWVANRIEHAPCTTDAAGVGAEGQVAPG